MLLARLESERLSERAHMKMLEAENERLRVMIVTTIWAQEF